MREWQMVLSQLMSWIQCVEVMEGRVSVGKAAGMHGVEGVDFINMPETFMQVGTVTVTVRRLTSLLC